MDETRSHGGLHVAQRGRSCIPVRRELWPQWFVKLRHTSLPAARSSNDLAPSGWRKVKSPVGGDVVKKTAASIVKWSRFLVEFSWALTHPHGVSEQWIDSRWCAVDFLLRAAPSTAVRRELVRIICNPGLYKSLVRDAKLLLREYPGFDAPCGDLTRTPTHPPVSRTEERKAVRTAASLLAMDIAFRDIREVPKRPANMSPSLIAEFDGFTRGFKLGLAACAWSAPPPPLHSPRSDAHAAMTCIDELLNRKSPGASLPAARAVVRGTLPLFDDSDASPRTKRRKIDLDPDAWRLAARKFVKSRTQQPDPDVTMIGKMEVRTALPTPRAALPTKKSEILAHLRSLDGPRDEFRDMEDVQAARGLTLDPEVCIQLGVQRSFMEEWFSGVKLGLTMELQPQVFPDFPAYSSQPAVVRSTLQELSFIHKIVWYKRQSPSVPPQTGGSSSSSSSSSSLSSGGLLPVINPALVPGLACSPGNIVDKIDGVEHVGYRFIKDWTYSGLNAAVEAVDVDYADVDRLLAYFYPFCQVGGLDVKHCFYTWLVHPEYRRWLGMRMAVAYDALDEDRRTLFAEQMEDAVRQAFLEGAPLDAHAIAVLADLEDQWAAPEAFGSLLFLGQGLGPSPGINDRNIKEVIRVCCPPELVVVDFVDDLRILPAYRGLPADVRERAFDVLVSRMTAIGLALHTKPGPKFFRPTVCFEWIGLAFDSRPVPSMTLSLAPSRARKAVAKLGKILAMARAGEPLKARDAATARGLWISFSIVFPTWPAVFVTEASRLLKNCGAERQWCKGNSRFNPRIPATEILLLGIEWWIERLGEVEFGGRTIGRSILYKPAVSDTDVARSSLWSPVLPDPVSGYKNVFTRKLLRVRIDASDHGWGAVLHEYQCEAVLLGPFAWDDPEHLAKVGFPGVDRPHPPLIVQWKPVHNNIKEATAVLRLIGAVLDPDLLWESTVFIESDNTATVAALARTVRSDPPGVVASPKMAAIGLAYRVWEQRLRCCLSGLHLEGKENRFADAISRLVLSSSDVDPEPARFLSTHAANAVRAVCKKGFNVEAFGPIPAHAHISFFIAKADLRWRCSLQDDFFNNYKQLLSERSNRVWIFPPWDQLREVVKVVRKSVGSASSGSSIS